MRLTIASIAFIAPILLILIAIPVKAMDLDLSLPTSSALTIFTDGDWDIMKKNARKVLSEQTDGNAQQWVNNETGHSGNITALSTSTIDGRLCRKTQFVNIAGDTFSTTLVNLCQQDGKWFEESLRTTATVIQNNPIEQPQTVLHETTQPQGPVTSKKVISRTSERCRELSQNIEKLKGKPLRRSAARDLYKAECLN